ncbi:unnamed protein product [Hymenolepis diminuta]|uniref:Uncharacterized protein n=1 Tax=Hymenolepis diminuta TaxID=6216 RepID=A0A564Z698_HYMDI|nr:unnamed protein product [Hymenolepis diminuta]
MDENEAETFSTADLAAQFGQILISDDDQTRIEVDEDDEFPSTNFESNFKCPPLPFPSESVYNAIFGETQLIGATRTNDLHQMAVILRYSKNIDKSDNYGNTALHYAAINGFMDGVNLLIKNRCNLNVQNIIGLSPLMEAIFNHHTDVANRLLEAGASPYILSSSFESAITHAASMNCSELLYRMLYVQSNTVAQKQALEYALVSAAKTRNVVLADALLNRGAEINLSIPIQMPLLSISAGIGDDILVTKWINAGANVEGRDHLGLTPLMHAAISGHLNICQILISRGANVSAQCEGKTAKDVALENGQVAVAQYLQMEMLKN